MDGFPAGTYYSYHKTIEVRSIVFPLLAHLLPHLLSFRPFSIIQKPPLAATFH